MIYKDVERKFWVEIFGEPIYESRFTRIIIKDEQIKLFIVTTKKWYDLHEDINGQMYFKKRDRNGGKYNRYLTDKFSEIIKEAVIEYTLLED